MLAMTFEIPFLYMLVPATLIGLLLRLVAAKKNLKRSEQFIGRLTDKVKELETKLVTSHVRITGMGQGEGLLRGEIKRLTELLGKTQRECDRLYIQSPDRYVMPSDEPNDHKYWDGQRYMLNDCVTMKFHEIGHPHFQMPINLQPFTPANMSKLACHFVAQTHMSYNVRSVDIDYCLKKRKIYWKGKAVGIIELEECWKC